MRAVFLALALAACAAQSQAPAADPGLGRLAGTRWVMELPADHAPGAAPPTIEFSDRGAAGFAGCNRWFGPAIHNDGDRLTFSGVGATRMACPSGAMSVEQRFLAALEATRRAHYDQDALVLFDEAQSELARFTRMTGQPR